MNGQLETFYFLESPMLLCSRQIPIRRVQLEQHHLLVSTKIVLDSSNLVVVTSIACRKCKCKTEASSRRGQR
jgi:hypothetical protein